MHNLWDSNIMSVLCDLAQAFFIFKELQCCCLDFLLTINNDVWDMIHLELTWRSCENCASVPRASTYGRAYFNIKLAQPFSAGSGVLRARTV
jgi:hypothetical protein